MMSNVTDAYFRAYGCDEWGTGWLSVADDDEDSTFTVLWCAEFGAVISCVTTSCDWLLPRGQRNLPRSAHELRILINQQRDFLHEFVEEEESPPFHVSSVPSDDDDAPLQRWLDTIHASSNPSVRLGLKMNVRRFFPMYHARYLHPRKPCGTPSKVAYDQSWRFLTQLAMTCDDT